VACAFSHPVGGGAGALAAMADTQPAADASTKSVKTRAGTAIPLRTVREEAGDICSSESGPAALLPEQFGGVCM